METKTFTEGQPIIVGLHGLAGTGKTTTATALVPDYQVVKREGFVWNHVVLASPLYEMVSIKEITEGTQARDRILYSLHKLLAELMGESPLYGAPPYKNLVSLVETIADMPLPQDGSKPRAFLQTVGTMCREMNEDCFVNAVFRSARKTESILIQSEKSALNPEDRDDYEPPKFIHIVSDVRLQNEAEAILEQPNGIIIEFQATETTRKNRLLDRDGFLMTDDQSNHATEAGLSRNLVSVILETDTLSVEEQAKITQQIIFEILEGI